MPSRQSFACREKFTLSSDWSAEIELGSLGRIRIRPINSKDAELYENFADHVTVDDLRRRFFGAGPELTPAVLERLTQIDRQKEMAFVGIDEKVPILLGIARLICDPEKGGAEFAILVRSDLQGRGVGSILMNQLVNYARAAGLAELHGSVLAENTNMLRLARKLGFQITTAIDDPGVLRLSISFASDGGS